MTNTGTKAPAATVHRMTVRRSTLPRMDHRLITCCDDTEQPFSVFWNNNATSQSRFAVLGTPSEVISQVIDHVTAGRDDEQTAQTAQTVRVMVGLNDDAIDGIKMLRQGLTYTTLKFRYLEQPLIRPAGTIPCSSNP